MSVETELKDLSTHALRTMLDGLAREMERLSFAPELQEIRDSEEWPHATWKAMAIMTRAVEAELAGRD